MEEKITSKKWFKLIPFGLVILNLLFMIIILSSNVVETEESVFKHASIFFRRENPAPLLCMIALILFIAQLVVYGFATYYTITKNKFGVYLVTIYSLVYSGILLALHIFQKIFSPFIVVMIVFSIIMMTAGVVLLKIIHAHDAIFLEKEKSDEKEMSSINKISLLILSILGFIATFSIFFVPIFTLTTEDGENGVYLIEALSSQDFSILTYTLFICFFIALFLTALGFVNSLLYYTNSKKLFAQKTKSCLIINMLVTLAFFLVGFAASFYYNIIQREASTVSYIPLILMLIVLMVYYIFLGKYLTKEDEELELLKDKAKLKIEPLFFVCGLTLVTVLSNLFNIIELEFEAVELVNAVKITGFRLLTDYPELSSGFQIIAFLIYAILIASGVLFVATFLSFFSKSRDYYKIMKVTAILNVLFMFFIGMSGIYFRVVQKINEEAILSLLQQLNLQDLVVFTYKINSQTIYPFIVSVAIVFVMIIRGIFNLQVEELPLLIKSKDDSKDETNNISDENGFDKEDDEFLTTTKSVDFDSCPAFTELDNKKTLFDKEQEKRKEGMFETLTLPELVRFIVEYAKESRLHLSYTASDVATFIAGLGASRLAILQGMSGTGKTSLPKIFLEAIKGNCEIVEVESSWRDKNELLGFYNEFSKSFTPKKFTQALYKAKLNPTIPTFIVLDEMNLSRIEYYFSDFLSLMENEEDKREIKLLNVKLFRTENNQKYSYLGLEEGHTLKIPTNVWFIGTANKDESTFEISDKVYDRAQTMNFNKRAPKITTFTAPIPARFLSYEKLNELLKKAKQSESFDAEGNQLVMSCEKILQPYNISFGNRILKQMEEFVKIYCACFNDSIEIQNEAIEKILLSKVVAKLEFKNVDDKDDLAMEFEEANLRLCAEFVRKLNGE